MPNLPPLAQAVDDNWIQVRRDRDTGIESVRAHFTGHAYDPHDHDELLIGFTEQGVQQFHCHRAVHTSVPGCAILIEPGSIHDGHAPEQNGFTYGMLNLPPAWVETATRRLGVAGIGGVTSAFARTLVDDASLVKAIYRAFLAIHHDEGRLARDQSLDALLHRLAGHARYDVNRQRGPRLAAVARVRDRLHTDIACNIGLEELAHDAGVDRFSLTREFKRAYGTSPHAYLVHLRLKAARRLLSAGKQPAHVASEVGFADQSHLGRWFRRAYGFTPATYQQMCTNVPD